MLEKIKHLRTNRWVNDLRDKRTLGFIVFGVIAILVTINTVGIIQTNYELQRKISQLEQQNHVYELERDNLKLRNEYYNTDQYLELAARKAFGRAAPGERVYIIPEKVAMQHTVPMPKEEQSVAETENNKPLYQRNFEAWADFFLHRR